MESSKKSLILGMIAVLLGAGLSTAEAKESAIQLTNESRSGAEFIVSQGGHLVIQTHVSGGASIAVPTSPDFMVTASTVVEGNTYRSSPIHVSAPSADMTAQLTVEHGNYVFQLTQSPGTVANTITLENTGRTPVQFEIAQPHAPLQIVKVADAYRPFHISTEQDFTVYAIANGVTTPVVSFTDPNATVRVIEDERGILELFVN
jgi:hypothetical protein